MIIVSDSTPIIALARIGSLDLLRSIFNTVSIPRSVYDEIVGVGINRPGAQEVAGASWINTVSVRNRRAVARLLSTERIDRGESEAIVLAQELKSDYLLLDDLKARAVARSMQIPIIGTVGVLLIAKENGLVPAIQPVLDALIAEGLRIHPKLYLEAMRYTGEL